jgi:hypothetical protein
MACVRPWVKSSVLRSCLYKLDPGHPLYERCGETWHMQTAAGGVLPYGATNIASPTMFQHVSIQTCASEFHVIIRWLGGVKAHCDLLSDVMFRMGVQMGAAKVVWLPAPWVCPLCCDRPPTTDGGRFDLDVCDGGIHSSVGSPVYSMPEGDEETDHETEEDEADNGCNEKHDLGVHTLMRPPDVDVFLPKRVPGEVYLKYLHDACRVS